MTRGTRCDFCHAWNWGSPAPRWCRGCRHRADRPRAECDCPRCARRPGRAPPPPGVTPADLAAIEEDTS